MIFILNIKFFMNNLIRNTGRSVTLLKKKPTSYDTYTEIWEKYSERPVCQTWGFWKQHFK